MFCQKISPHLTELIEMADLYQDIKDSTDVFVALSESDYDDSCESKTYSSPKNNGKVEINKNDPFIIREINENKVDENSISRVIMFIDFKYDQMIMCTKEGCTDIAPINKKTLTHMQDWYNLVQSERYEAPEFV